MTAARHYLCLSLDSCPMQSKNPFAKWQVDQQQRRSVLLRAFLVSLKKGRARFSHVSHVADIAAIYLSEKEGKPCSPSTLLRNPKYKALLLAHMEESIVGGTDSIDRATIRDPRAKALLDTADHRIENLRRENERLKSYIATKPASRDPVEGDDVDDREHKTVRPARPTAEHGVSADRIDYLTTCEVLHAVLRKFEGIVEIDYAGERIVDLTSSPPKDVVPTAKSKPFFEWWRRHR